jgi:hypothetical protein
MVMPSVHRVPRNENWKRKRKCQRLTVRAALGTQSVRGLRASYATNCDANGRAEHVELGNNVRLRVAVTLETRIWEVLVSNL